MTPSNLMHGLRNRDDNWEYISQPFSEEGWLFVLTESTQLW